MAREKQRRKLGYEQLEERIVQSCTAGFERHVPGRHLVYSPAHFPSMFMGNTPALTQAKQGLSFVAITKFVVSRAHNANKEAFNDVPRCSYVRYQEHPIELRYHSHMPNRDPENMGLFTTG